MLNRTIVAGLFAVCFASALLFACGTSQDTLTLPSDPAHYAPLEKYEAMKIPADNAITQDKATLGWQLWFDKRLSGDGKLACYSCHVNEKGLTDGLALNKGAFDKPLTRSAPKDKDEIRADIVAKLNEAYKGPFQKVFGGPANEKQIAQALATFMRTIISKTTPFDAWQKGDEAAVSDAAKRGYAAFQKAKCTNCHVGFLLTDLQFHNVGIGLKDGKPSDVGRFKVTNIEKDTGAFKTPTMRDVARTAPYFHDDSVATLEEAVKLMVGGGNDNPFLDKTNLLKAEISAAEQADIVEFLKSLTETARIPEPKLPQ